MPARVAQFINKTPTKKNMDFIDFKVLANAAIFSVVGIVIFILAAFVFEWVTPFKLWKEIVDNKNVAGAIVAGCAFLGLAGKTGPYCREL